MIDDSGQQPPVDESEQVFLLDDTVVIDLDFSYRPGSERARTETTGTGLTVPVELTMVSTLPRDTVAVRYFGTECRCHQEIAQTVAPAGTPSNTTSIKSHFTNRRMTAPGCVSSWFVAVLGYVPIIP